MFEALLAAAIVLHLDRLSRPGRRMSLLHRLAQLWLAVAIARLISRLL